MANTAKTIQSTNFVSVADAKAKFSSVLLRVEKKRLAVTILRRGIPIAQIVPMMPSKKVSGYGYMAGTAIETGDIVGPTGEEWIVADE